MSAIDSDALKEYIKKTDLTAVERGALLQAISNMSTLTPPNEWVSVEERLPTDERPVLAFIGYADTMNGFITTSYYFRFDPDPHWLGEGLIPVGLKTLFWMPLPAPPGKEG